MIRNVRQVVYSKKGLYFKRNNQMKSTQKNQINCNELHYVYDTLTKSNQEQVKYILRCKTHHTGFSELR